tara:strand:- start:11983 stop:12549 length:567 start_codon:yes stop_codon:yes gene_type:complete
MLIKNVKSLFEYLSSLNNDKILIKDFQKFSKIISNKLRKSGKIIICGNGGSFAEAQHFTAELIVRLKKNNIRGPIPSITLGSEGSTITAHSNDFEFNTIFSRQFEGLVKKNDILITLSTSGNSKNITNVIKSANKKKIFNVNLLGGDGGQVKKISKNNLIINLKDTARIQEIHLLLLHSLAEEIENNF